MTSVKLTGYTVTARSAGITCGVCGAKLRDGDKAISVYDPEGVSWHQHETCQRDEEDGASKAARLMQDIRDGKPPVNPNTTPMKVQGT